MATYSYQHGSGRVALIGDEKQAGFYPRLKIKHWDNASNFSVGLRVEGGEPVVNEQHIFYNHPALDAEFYPIESAQPPSENIRYINQGRLSADFIAAQYELDLHVIQTDMLINVHFPLTGMMYYGYYPKSAYLGATVADIPECRLAIHGAHNDPMYMNEGLPLIDVHYKPNENPEKIADATKQAITTALKPYGVTPIFQGGKGFFQHGPKLVKFFSCSFDGQHFYYYLNLDCDYNHAYDFYERETRPRANPDAYGLRALNPDIPDSLVDEIVQLFAGYYGLPLYEDELTQREKDVIASLLPIHNDKQWIDQAERPPMEATIHHTDGFEFAITLKQKPDSNQLPLSVTHKNLLFLYQPPLTLAEQFEMTRPPDVVGSYAVYHPTKAGIEGKAFHLYRPWAEDATGQRVWCDFDPDFANSRGVPHKDELLITVPQAFIDSAVYPIVIDPTFGYTTAGSTATTAVAGTIYGLLSQAGSVGTIQYGTTAYNNVSGDLSAMALYNSSGATLLTNTAAVSMTAADNNEHLINYTQWRAQPITAVNYDIAWWTNQAGTYSSIYSDTQTNAGATFASTFSATTWPASVTWVTNNNRYSLSIYYHYPGTPGNIGRYFSVGDGLSRSEVAN